MPDYWNECFVDPALAHVAKQGPESFVRFACRVCRNSGCDRVLGRNPDNNPWVERMLTQEDRLLDNPQFADPNDPQFEPVRRVDFKSAFREAISLEVAAEKGDWNIPTAADAVEYMARTREPDPEPPARLIDEVKLIGDEIVPTKLEAAKSDRAKCRHCHTRIPKGVTRFGRNVADPVLGGKVVWTWYHVPCAEQRYPEELAALQGVPPPMHYQPEPETPPPALPEPPVRRPEPEPVVQAPAPPAVPVPVSRTANAVVGPERQDFVPPAMNTPMPRGGVMIGGGPPKAAPTPAHDPWAIPAAAAKVVSAGATIQMGGEPPKGDE